MKKGQGAPAAATSEGEAYLAELTLEQIREKLWRSLPSVQALLVERTSADDGGAANNEINNEDLLQPFAKDTHVPYKEIEQMVQCIYLATVRNPARIDMLTFTEDLIGSPSANGEHSYTKVDVLFLFDDLVKRYMKQKTLEDSGDTFRHTCADIVECITFDDPPHPLVATDAVLCIRDALVLQTPLSDFVSFRQHPLYPPIYDELWAALQDGRAVDTLSLNEFKMFFSWFHRLHVADTTATRCEGAALAVWRDGVNPKGKMDRASFQCVCQSLSEKYAKRLDAAVYLSELLHSTRQRLAAAGSGTEGVVLFSAPEGVLQGIRPRIHLSNPNQLYMPDTLHAWDREVNAFAHKATVNRLFVMGKRGTGKTTVGRHLSEALRAAHLDVVSLVLRSLASDDKQEIDMTVALCMEKGTPISVEVQAALIRRELEKPYVLYHGFVFSDPIVFSDTTREAAASFYEQSGLLDLVQPRHFVELTCADCVYGEQLKRVLADYDDASRSAFSQSVSEKEEKVNMMKQCAHIIDNYRTLLETPDTPQEDLDAAAQQAEEAQQIMDALEAEEAAATDGRAGGDEDDDAAVTGRGPTEEADKKAEEAEKAAAAAAAALERKATVLVRNGRSHLFQGTEEAPLRSLPGMKALLDSAAAMDTVVSVSGLSPAEDTVSYVTTAFGLAPPSIATEVPLAEEPPFPPTQEAEEERYGALLEQAASTENIHPSYYWKKYCPVTFLNDQVLVEGAACYSCVYENHLYYFASLQKKAEFIAYPTRFLSQAPVTRQPLILVADPSVFEMDKTPSKEQLVAELADALKLTPLSLVDFKKQVEQYNTIRDGRKDVQTAREKFAMTEGVARREREEKRIALGAKKAKPKNDRTRQSVTIMEGSQTKEVLRPRQKRQQQATARVQDNIARVITEVQTGRQTLVPVLLTAVENDAENVACVKLLAKERLLPNQVIVLEYKEEFILPPREEEAPEAPQAATAADEGEEKPAAFESQKDLLAEVESGAAAKATVYRLNTFGKSERNLISEIQQLVNPAFPQAEEAQVDEALAEDEEEEEEDEPMLEDEDEDGEENNAKAMAALKPDPLLRPRHKYDHQFGALLQYCPVTFLKKGILVKGNKELSLSYLGSLYLFASEECKDEFKANPLRFLRGVSIRHTPPRLWLVGPSNAGKKTLASSLNEKYGIPFFEYNRGFFEKCIECALSPTGGHVKGIFVPPQAGDKNYYLERAFNILSHVRRVQKEEDENLKLREEALKKLEELEEKQNEERSADEEDEEEGLGEDYENRLRMQAEFEPEEEEEKQIRLSESYLRVASCVVRIEPFETKGYMMICPPFSVGDLDVLFGEGGIPEVIVNMNLSKEVFVKRGMQLYEAEQAQKQDIHKKVEQVRKQAREQKAKLEKKRAALLRRWRRRNIGADDPPTGDDDGEDGQEAKEGDAKETEPEEPQYGPPDFEGTAALQHEKIEEFVEAVEERLVKVVTLRVDLAPGAVLLTALEELNLHLESRISLFFAPEIVAFDKALQQLERGLSHYSSFQKTDPVRLADVRDGERRACFWKPSGVCMVAEEGGVGDGADGAAAGEEGLGAAELAEEREPEDDGEITEYGEDDLEEMRARNDRRERLRFLHDSPRAVLLGPFIYFLETDANLKKFLRNPIVYVEQAPPTPHLREMPVVSVFEDDVLAPSFAAHAEAGVKVRCLAESVAHNRHAVFVSVGKLLSWALRQPRLGSVACQAVEATLSGVASDALLESLLALRLSAADVKQRGAVLLNLPRTPQQLSATERREVAPIVRVASLVKDQGTDLHALLAAMACAMLEKAHVEWSAPHPTMPSNPTNLNEMVRAVDTYEGEAREAILRRQHAFPIDMTNLYYPQKGVADHLSEYKLFCPYCWLEKDDLIVVDQSYGAWYMGKYYFFSSGEYHRRFLRDPTEVADPTSLRPLPPILPEAVTDEKEAKALRLELQGCCPVLLYDTRDRKGLRGNIEPVAEVGSRACVVRYDGKAYAMLNEANKARFLQRPWQYVKDAVVPEARKCPLPPSRAVTDLDDEEFIRRQLYDSVASAMVGVGSVRPSYPGLTVEESALKFIALHLKAHNTAENNKIQTEQYAHNFELYFKRATLYQAMTTEEGEMTEGKRKKEFAALCDDYEKLQYGYHGIHTLAQLKNSTNVRRDSLL